MENERNNFSAPRFETVFYFQKNKIIGMEWCYVGFRSVFLLGTFLIAARLAQQDEAGLWVGLSYLFAGMLLNIPVDIVCAVWKSTRCLSRLTFDNTGIMANEKIYYRSDIQNVEKKKEYMKISTYDGKEHSYWMGDGYLMPQLVREKLLFVMKNFSN